MWELQSARNLTLSQTDCDFVAVDLDLCDESNALASPIVNFDFRICDNERPEYRLSGSFQAADYLNDQPVARAD